MIPNLKLALYLGAVLSFLGAIYFWHYQPMKSLEKQVHNAEIEIKNYKEAIKAYEKLIKVIPYNAMASERKDKADEDINATLSNDNSISDNVYRL